MDLSNVKNKGNVSDTAIPVLRDHPGEQKNELPMTFTFFMTGDPKHGLICTAFSFRGLLKTGDP